MPRPIPIYHEHDESYRADSCQPLITAADNKQIKLEALRHGHYPGRMLPHNALPGMKMAGYWDAQENQNWGLGWHRNEGLELTLLERGHLEFGLGDVVYQLNPGDLTITRPWQLHRVGNPNIGASHLIWVIIDLGVRRPNEEWKWPSWLLLSRPDLAELANILRHNEQPVWTANQEIRRCVHAIEQAVRADHGGSHVSHLSLRINELFLYLVEMLRENKVLLDHSLSSTRRTVELFLNDLRVHAEHLKLKWSLDQMAESCGLGVTQFVHHARELTNMSPLQYLNRCRLDAAAAALVSKPHASVTDIALAFGFSSSQYFATTFCRRFGTPPTEFRSAKLVDCEGLSKTAAPALP